MRVIAIVALSAGLLVPTTWAEPIPFSRGKSAKTDHAPIPLERGPVAVIALGIGSDSVTIALISQDAAAPGRSKAP